MDNKKSHAEKIASMVDALADLSSEDLEEAKAVLIAAGKDPDAILANGLRALQKIRSNYSRSKAAMVAVQSDRKVNAGCLVIAKNDVSGSIDLLPYSSNYTILDAEQVYRTFIKHEPFQNTLYSNLNVNESIRALTFNKLVRTLRFTVNIGAEFASVSPAIKERGNTIPLSFGDLPVIQLVGYFIENQNWLPIDKDALEFLGAFIHDIDDECQMALSKALYYFSKRQSYQWLSFDDEELDFSKILKSDKYSSISRLFVRELYQYQKEGLQWLLFCCMNRIGGILADDMGLGKTAQTIALVSWIIEKDFFENVLIVVPSTLLENWRREFDFFAPAIVPYTHHGNERSGSITLMQKQKVVLTSYSMIINDEFLFDKINWGLLILDEASLIKNPDSERRLSVNKIKAQVRIAMTGTPVENSLIDLWSIGDFVNPNYFGTREEFASKYIKKDIETTIQESNLTVLKKDVSYIMLRRKKEDVLEMLPDKIDIHQALEMGRKEAELYDNRRESILEQANAGERGGIFKLIQDLRQYTTHPLLMEDHRLETANLTDLAESSAKFRRTVELLDEIRINNEKVLIFTEYLDMIDTFKRILSTHYGIRVYTIDGRIETSDRQLNIDRFTESEGFGVMILNPKTGGMGLNITAANHVIHYTRQWNPALEEQATARVYRNKQEKGVNVYYLYYVNTIEELIDSRLRSKAALSGEVISVTEPELTIEQYISILSKSPLKNK